VFFDVFVAFVLTASAQGQVAQPRRPSGPRLDLSIGSGFIGSSGLGSVDADLRGSGSASFQLFATSSRLGQSIPLEVRIDFLVSPRYVLEMRGAWSRPELKTSVSGDVEGAPPLDVIERIDQYSLDVGLLITLKPPRLRAIVPFIAAGAGYVGAVHEGLTLLENGFGFRGGGGFKYPLTMRDTGRLKGSGVRVDTALILMASGLASGSGVTSQIAASGSFYLTF
jgi:hypothetical protein